MKTRGRLRSWLLICSVGIPCFAMFPSVATAVAKASSVDEQQQSMLVEKIEVEGSTIFSKKDFAPILKQYENKKLTLAQLQEAAAKISNLYQAKGYLLVKAYIPKQNFADKTASIKVLEGRVGQVIVKGEHPYYSDDFIKKHFTDLLRTDQIFDQAKLERAVLVLNENLKLNVSATLQPGTAPGTTDVVVTAMNSLPMSIGFDYNNFGNKYVGEHRFGATWDIGNLLKEGSKLTLRGLTSEKPDDLHFGRAEYSLPINTFGSRLGAYLERGNFDVGRELAILNIKGDILSYGIYGTHPFIKRKQHVLTGRFGFDAKKATQDMLGAMSSEDKLRILTAGVDYEGFDAKGRCYAGMTLSQGLGSALGGMENNSFYASRYEADNSFTKLGASAMRVHRFSDMFYGVARLTGQYATDSLVSSELFSIGGGNSVRGFAQGEYTGDHGVNATAELRIAPFTVKETVQFATFIDYGWVRTITPTPAWGQYSSTDITGAGVGLRLKLPYDVSINADVGFPIEPSTSADGDDMHFYLSAAFKR